MGISQKIKDRMESGENSRWIPMKRYNTKTAATLRYLLKESEKNKLDENDIPSYVMSPDSNSNIQDHIKTLLEKYEDKGKQRVVTIYKIVAHE